MPLGNTGFHLDGDELCADMTMRTASFMFSLGLIMNNSSKLFLMVLMARSVWTAFHLSTINCTLKKLVFGLLNSLLSNSLPLSQYTIVSIAPVSLIMLIIAVCTVFAFLSHYNFLII